MQILKAVDMRVRRAAEKAGFIASKSRDRTTHGNNRGGYMLSDARTGLPVYGLDYDLSPEAVLSLCSDKAQAA